MKFGVDGYHHVCAKTIPPEINIIIKKTRKIKIDLSVLSFFLECNYLTNVVTVPIGISIP
jgi:hypothetical protein